MFAKAKRKLQERMQRIAEATLEDDERLVAGSYVVQPPPVLLFGAGLIAFGVVLALNGYQLRSWVVGASVGTFIVLNTRYMFLLLTNKRLVHIRLSQFSQKRWRVERSLPIEQIAAIRYNEGVLSDSLRISVDGRWDRKFKIGRPWRQEGRHLGHRLQRHE